MTNPETAKRMHNMCYCCTELCLSPAGHELGQPDRFRPDESASGSGKLDRQRVGRGYVPFVLEYATADNAQFVFDSTMAFDKQALA